MAEIAVQVPIAASPARVWEVLEDLERWPEWTSSVRRLTLLDPAPLREGSRARVEQPRLRPALWTVTSHRPGVEFSWATRSPGVVTIAEHWIEPSAAGCVVSLRVRFAGPLRWLARRLAGGLTRRYMAIEAEGLRRRAEGDGAAR